MNDMELTPLERIELTAASLSVFESALPGLLFGSYHARKRLRLVVTIPQENLPVRASTG